MNPLVKRLLTGLVLLATVIGTYYFFAMEGIRTFALAMFFIATHEVYKVLKIKNKKPSYITPVLCLATLSSSFFLREVSLIYWSLLVSGPCLILWSQIKTKNISEFIENYFIEILLFIFVGGFGSLCLFGFSGVALSEISFASRSDAALHFLSLLFLTSFGCDVGAYFAGVTFGKGLFYPQISPKKTWAGFFGGIFLAVLSAVVYHRLFSLDLDGLPYVGLILVAAIATIHGDLLMSLVKRSAGIKDFGNIFPGHGGVLDRADGLLMASPIIYVLIYYI